jgi:hypothetical protein
MKNRKPEPELEPQTLGDGMGEILHICPNVSKNDNDQVRFVGGSLQLDTRAIVKESGNITFCYCGEEDDDFNDVLTVDLKKEQLITQIPKGAVIASIALLKDGGVRIWLSRPIEERIGIYHKEK